MRRLLSWSCTLMLAFAPPAVAQNSPAPAERCRAHPDDKAQQDDKGAQTAPDGQNKSLTETLDPCNGVLKPPPVGDEELTEPPPAEGKTPIIRPNEIPEQQPGG